MRTSWPAVVALALLAPLGTHTQPVQAQAAPAAVPQARVIVKFKADAAVVRQRALSASASAAAGERASVLGQRAGVALQAGAMAGERSQVVMAAGLSSEALARRLAADPEVEYAEPDVRQRRMAPPNDPRYAAGLGGNGPAAGQWYLRPPTGTLVSAINAEAAWDVTTGSNSIVVAVLDTGVRLDHADLGANLLPGYDWIAADRSGTGLFYTANDGNGRDADPSDPGDWVSDADLASGNFNGCVEEDSSWHGTQTASLIGALTDNGLGMASVGRNVRVLPVRVLGKCGGYTSDIVAGMRWAAGITVDGLTNPNPAHVINMSLGGAGACTQTYQDAINEVVARGVTVVVSAGNSDGQAVSSPANCNGVIAVTGLRHAGTKVGFADVGPQVTIAAPGGNCVNLTGACLYPIITATNSGTTTPVANSSVYTDSVNPAYGTSFSAPLVAGTVGLMLSERPDMTPGEVRAALQGSARVFPATGADAGVARCHAPNGQQQLECYCTTSTCGAGMLDARAAVLAADRGLQARITPPTGTLRAGVPMTLSASGSYVADPRTITAYQWEIADGGGIVTSLTPSGASVSVTATGTGRYTLRLTVTDSTGAQSSTEQAVDVTVGALPPPSDGGGGGGALGLAWLAGLAAAVIALRRARQAP